MPYISVIIPLYNAGRFLEECLNSVLRQSFYDFECICINDASSDNTNDILKKYQLQDSRIKILNNRVRSGAAFSRNRGISISKGKYLFFLDGDDVFDEDMFRTCFYEAETMQIDVLLFESMHVPTEQIGIKRRINHSEEYQKKYYNTIISVKEDKPYEFLLWKNSPWDKMYRKDFIINNNISFQSLSSCNDVYFVNMALLLSRRTKVLSDNRVMVYARDHTEPSRISNHRDPMCCYYAYEYLLDELIKRGEICNVFEHFLYKSFFAFKYTLENNSDSEKSTSFYSYLQEQGINNFVQKISLELINKNKYLVSMLERFQNPALSRLWLKDETILKMCLVDNQELFFQINSERQKGKKIILWGCGNNGKAMLNICDWKKCNIDYVVDSDGNKQGKCINNHLICAPKDVINNLALVIFSPNGSSDEVRKQVLINNKESKVIDIVGYLAIN